jgi:hypothetical protein
VDIPCDGILGRDFLEHTGVLMKDYIGEVRKLVTDNFYNNLDFTHYLLQKDPYSTYFGRKSKRCSSGCNAEYSNEKRIVGKEQ